MNRLNNLKGKTFFVGVGAQKAGTTWLYGYLRSHPDVAVSPIKELHYFDQIYRPELCGHWYEKFKQLARDKWQELEEVNGLDDVSTLVALIDRLRMNSDPRAYLEYFDRAASRGALAVGEITPSYSLLPTKAFAKIRTMLIEAGCVVRVIFLMRDPCERFWSQLRFYNGKGSKEQLDIQFTKALSDPQFIERSRYDLVISRLEDVFEPDEISFHFYETMFQQSEINKICQFLRIGNFPGKFDSIWNASPTQSITAQQRKVLRNHLDAVYAAVTARFGNAVPATWFEPEARLTDNGQ